jgi:peroxiredoxin
MSMAWKPPKLTGKRSTDISGLLFLLIVVIAVFAALREKRDRQTYDSAPVPGETAPAYTASAQDGTSVPIQDYRGNVLLLTFWTRDCSACVDQFRAMEALRDELSGAGLELVSVNLEEGDRELVRSYLDALGYDWQNLFDNPSHVAQVFGWGRALPRTLLLNRDGTVRVWWRGQVDPTLPENRALIDEAMAS